MTFLTIIIPAKDEEKNIERTVEAFISKIKMNDFEVLICDDHSTDSTFIVSKNLAKRFSHVKALKSTTSPGFGNVLRFGVNNSKSEFILPVMADLSDDPLTVERMVEKAKEGFDVVVGSRYMRKGGKKNVNNRIKSLISKLIGIFGFYVLHLKTLDSTNAFKLIRREAFLRADPRSNTFDVSLELTVKLNKLGYKIAEVPTVWTDRSEGKSKFKFFSAGKNYIRWLLF